MLQTILKLLSQNRKNSKVQILVVGDVMLDEYLSGLVERISPEAPIPVVVGEETEYKLGGAANVAANLASLGATVNLVGLVGHDDTYHKFVDLLGTLNIDSGSLVVSKSRKTTRKLRVVSGKQQIVRIDYEDKIDLSEQETSALLTAVKNKIQSVDALIVSDYDKGVCNPDVLSELIKWCRQRGVPVIVDPKGNDFVKYQGATLIKPNKKEASIAVKKVLNTQKHLEQAALQIRRKYNIDTCLITMGADGMMLSQEDGFQTVSGLAQDVADVTGAGDTVAAALAFALAHKLSNTDACQFANAAAALAVSKLGSVAVDFDEVSTKFLYGSMQSTASVGLSDDLVLHKINQFRKEGKTIVFTNGCFDLLHVGHVHSLKCAAEFGDVLVVGINSDESVGRLKGEGRPLNCAEDRAIMLANLRVVDIVVIFYEDTPYRLIDELKPDVLVKGSDYANTEVVGRELVESRGGRMELVPMIDGYSTTSILQKIEVSNS